MIEIMVCHKSFLLAYNCRLPVGLSALLDAIEAIGSRRVSALSDAMLLLECVSCIKTVLNSKVGIEYIIEHPEGF